MLFRYPEKNSRGEQILKVFHQHGPMTIHQGTERHGEFSTLRVPNGVDHSKMLDLYCDLVERACLVRESILYRLSVRAEQHLDKLARPQEPGQIVPPRVRSFLHKVKSFGNSPFTPNCLSL